MIRIALDAMGGDHGPEVTVPAALRVLARHSALTLTLVGDEALIRPHLQGTDFLKQRRLKMHHTVDQIAMDDTISVALRNRKASMRLAINLVKEGEAQACVSAGNTGALVATARFVLKTLPGIDRPAIMTAFPTYGDGVTRVLDLGANVDSEAEHLYQFAVMGSVVAAAIGGIPAPRVGILNIGEEMIKGNDRVKKTAQLLSQSNVLQYVGYVEGDDLFKGVVDVVVCDGFVGNVTLKSCEGVAKLIAFYLKESVTKHWWGRALGWLFKPMLKELFQKLDTGRRNGASLLGLRGIVVKSHGGASVSAFANAIEEAISEVENNVVDLIQNKLESALQKKPDPS